MAGMGDWREDVLEVLTGMFAEDDGIDLGQMMGHPAFYVKNASGKRKMFATVYGPGVALKLPADEIDELLTEPGYEPFAPMGQPMNGWIVAFRDDAQEWAGEEELLSQAMDFVAGG